MLRKKLCIFLLILFCFFLSGCTDTVSDAQASFTQIMLALTSGETEQINTYYDLNAFPVFKKAENREELLNAITRLLKNTSYTILQTESHQNKAFFRVSLSVPDNAQIINKFAEALSLMTSEKEYKNFLSAQTASRYQTMAAERLIKILDEPISFSEQTVEVSMYKIDGHWAMNNDENELINLLFLNLEKSLAAIV